MRKYTKIADTGVESEWDYRNYIESRSVEYSKCLEWERCRSLLESFLSRTREP